ncbi:MAG: ABC transporter ATP-binding protein/permease [Clostridium sp.]|nr:ABC transporter ATP-binding protein/permease [Clostridium sp.]
MKTASRKLILGKLLKKSRSYLPVFILSVVLAVLTVIGTLLAPLFIGQAIDCIVGAGDVDFDRILLIFIKIAVSVGIAALAQWLLSLCSNRMTYGIVHDIRDEAFDHIQRLPLSYLDSHPTGDIVSRIITDVEQLANGLLLGFTNFFTGVMTILGALAFMLSVNLPVALVVVVVTPLSLICANLITKHTYSMFNVQTETRGEQTALIDELISGQKVVQAFGYEDRAQQHFDEINGRLKVCSLRALFYSSLTNPSTRFVNALAYAGIGTLGAITAISGGISVGGLASLLAYANQYTKPFNEITDVIAELQNALACAGRLFELIEAPEQSPDPTELPEPSAPKGTVEFDDLTFSYSPDKPLIRNFSLRVKPGQLVAIVGPTGCGKTTLINLLMRFYDPVSGRILVDGTDTKSMPRGELRGQFGMVLQETWLKEGTIRENIAMGRPDAGEDEIIAAATASHAHDFIKRLPDGYDTVIGESGGNLSQGQKQLLCIARVMLSHPPMLILDEATSSIDTRTEMQVQDAFRRLMKGRTTFIVAHRLSTIREADVILVMRDGRIVEQGSHRELLDRNGFYRELYDSQFAH